MSIPKILNVVWIGDQQKLPQNFIDTWQITNPQWQIKIWDNQAFDSHPWETKHHMLDMLQSEQLCGVADLMRWEILYQYGGFTIDADFISIRSLPDWFAEASFIAGYENERVRAGLVSNGFMGAEKQLPLIRNIIDFLLGQQQVSFTKHLFGLVKRRQKAWKITGPKTLTKFVTQSRVATIIPSHFLLPEHFSGEVFQGNGPVYAYQMWGSTSRGSKGKSFQEFSPQELIDFAKNRLSTSE